MHIIKSFYCLCATESAAQFTKSSTMTQHFKLTVKDRRRQSDGVNESQSKFFNETLAVSRNRPDMSLD
jgi:hypothetical protein